MSIEELMKLSHSSQAPFNREEYTIWLHNKIVEKMQYEIWQYRESIDLTKPSGGVKYAHCNKFLTFESIKSIK